MSLSALDPHAAQVQSDELIPAFYEEPPLTFLDEIGLDRQLDGAVAGVRRALGDAAGHRTDDEIRLALAAHLDRLLRDRLARAAELVSEGADEFFSALAAARRPDATAAGPAPPASPAADETHADQVF